MTQFIVHVGPHKTGTTYLQDCFSTFRPKLAQRGIHFPTVWGPAAHHALYEKLLVVPNKKLEAEFAEIHAGGHPAVLISVEGLTGLPEASVAYLRELVGTENPLRCIFYARAWADLLPSHWKEEVKGGETETLPEYMHRQLHTPATSSFVNFGIGLRIWAKHFGPDAIRIVAYNRLMSLKQDLFVHFAEQFLDWPSPPRPEIARANVSPESSDIEMIRTIAALERTRLGRPLSRAYAVALSESYMQRKDELLLAAASAALERHATNLVVNELGSPLSAVHRELMAEFGGNIVEPRLNDMFFMPRTANVSYVQSDWILVEGVLDDVRAIHHAIYSAMTPTARVRAETETVISVQNAACEASSKRPDPTLIAPEQPPANESWRGNITVVRVSSASLGMIPPAPSPRTGGIATTVTFGYQGDAEGAQRAGWARGENGFTWAIDGRSVLVLPRPDRAVGHLLQFGANPFISTPGPAQQRIQITIDGASVGVATLVGPSIVTCKLPGILFEANPLVDLTFELPDAMRPSDVRAGAADHRVLGAAFSWLQLISYDGSADNLVVDGVDRAN